jgi:hypothetical protein
MTYLLVVCGAGGPPNSLGAAGYIDATQLLSTDAKKTSVAYARSWSADSERVSHESGRWSW